MPFGLPPIRPPQDDAPPALPPIQQSAPDLVPPSPTQPSSVLGDAVAPGQPIAPEQMHQAKMKNIHEQAATNRDALANLDWQDPDYTKKLTKLHMQHGELERVAAEEKAANPWGTPGNHPGVLGKIGHGLAVAGNIAGNALAPGLMQSIPGSQANLAAQEQAGTAEEAAAEKEGEQAATTAATEAEVPLKEAQTKEAGALAEKAQAEAGNVGETKIGTESEAVTLHDLMTGENGQPRINPKTNQPYTYLEAYEATKQAGATAQKKNPEEQYIEDFFKRNPNATMADAVRAYARDSQRPERAGAENNRADRSWQVNQGRLDKIRGPIDQLATRFSRLQDTLNQRSPQADALVAPELLTIMAGGMGSGLRMNEAEIARIVGGRSAWENLKGAMQHWQTNPDDARSITPDQDRQIRALIDTVGKKIIAKQAALERGQEMLLSSDDPHQHRQIVANVQKQLDAVDAGAAETGGGTGKAVSLAAARGLPQNKGKSDDEIRADIEAHGHKVVE